MPIKPELNPCNFLGRNVVWEFVVHESGGYEDFKKFKICRSSGECQKKKFGKIIGDYPPECPIPKKSR